MLFAVNGTLMRGFELNRSLVKGGAIFVGEARTAPIYRLWSIHNQYPAMLRDSQGGAAIAIELWDLSPRSLISILENEPPGLTAGRILLEDGRSVLGILGEPYILADGLEITQYRGWREYRARSAG